MKKLSIFLSSTFSDMHKERDIFVNEIIPLVNAEIAKLGLYADVVDLRWGIDTNKLSEQEKNKKVLLSCIDEIDKTEPFFISMLGNRYGWIPQHDDIDITFQSEDAKEFYDKSVTQIEIEHALMKFKDCSRCIFLFRSDENSCDDDERLKKLKTKIQADFPEQVILYNASCRNNEYFLDENFASEISSKIVSLIADEYKNYVPQSKTEELIQLTNTEIFKSNEMFSGRNEFIKEFRSFLDSDFKFLHLLGESGFGKSFLLGKFVEISKENNYKTLAFYPASSNDVQISTLLNVLAQQLGCCEDIVANSEDAVVDNKTIANFLNTLNEKSGGEKTLVIIDALNQFPNLDLLQSFFNQHIINDNIKIVVSSTPYTSINKYIQSLSTKIMNVTEFTQEDVIQVFNKHFKIQRKTPPEHIIKNIWLTNKKLKHSLTNPLFLQFFLESISKLNEKDYKEIKALESGCNSFDKALSFYQKEKAKKSPTEITGMIEELIASFASVVENGLVYYIASAFNFSGSSIESFKKIFELAGLEFSNADFYAFLAFNKQFLYNKNSEIFDYKHNLVKTNILKIASKDPIFSKVFNCVLDNYISNRGTSIFNLNDILYPACITKNYEGISKILNLDESFSEINEVFLFWLKDEPIVETFSNIIKYDPIERCSISFIKSVLVDKSTQFKINITLKDITKLANIVPTTYKKRKGLRFNLLFSYVELMCTRENYYEAYKILKLVKKQFGFNKGGNTYGTKLYTKETVKETECFLAIKNHAKQNVVIYDKASIYNMSCDQISNHLDKILNEIENPYTKSSGISKNYSAYHLIQKCKEFNDPVLEIKSKCIYFLENIYESSRLKAEPYSPTRIYVSDLYYYFREQLKIDQENDLLITLSKTLALISAKGNVEDIPDFAKYYYNSSKKKLLKDYSPENLARYVEALELYYDVKIASFNDDENLKKELILSLKELLYFKQSEYLIEKYKLLTNQIKYDETCMSKLSRFESKHEKRKQIKKYLFAYSTMVIVNAVVFGVVTIIQKIMSKNLLSPVLFSEMVSIFSLFFAVSVFCNFFFVQFFSLMFLRKTNLNIYKRFTKIMLTISIAGIACFGSWLFIRYKQSSFLITAFFKVISPGFLILIFLTSIYFAIYATKLTVFNKIDKFEFNNDADEYKILNGKTKKQVVDEGIKAIKKYTMISYLVVLIFGIAFSLLCFFKITRSESVLIHFKGLRGNYVELILAALVFVLCSCFVFIIIKGKYLKRGKYYEKELQSLELRKHEIHFH